MTKTRKDIGARAKKYSLIKIGEEQNLKYALTAFLIFISDRVSKWMVMQRMVEGQSIPLIPPAFYLTYVRNTGAAFGILRGRTLFISLFSVAGVIYVLARWKHIMRKSALVKWGVTRCWSTIVTWWTTELGSPFIDFIDVPVWPIFNVADVAIVGGVALLFWEVLFREES